MNLKKWLQVAFINLLIVAAIGVILRYKIAYSLSFIDQKKLLHAHSHFALYGWASQALMALIVSRLSVYSLTDLFKRYNWILSANLICAYGMLFSFPLQGYGPVSITFCVGAIIVSYVFAFYVWSDINKCKPGNTIFGWFKAAVFFNALSSLGTFTLAYMMATKNVYQDWYLGSLYFFLHFQYNGWFSFALLGLLFEKLEEAKVNSKVLKNIFIFFVCACIPAYFLSVLWLAIPVMVYVLVVVSAIIQLAGWIWAIKLIRKKMFVEKNLFSSIPRIIITLSLIAFSIKIVLQAGSVVPSLSTFAFGFRPIIIGYLHLVFLGMISLFILGYSMSTGSIEVNRKNKTGVFIFIAGIILNELALMIQGVMALDYISIPHINDALFIVALVLFSGLLIINLPAKKA